MPWAYASYFPDLWVVSGLIGEVSSGGAGGKLGLAQLLRCRVRYLSDGLVIGTEAFVEQVFRSMREAFSAGRETGAREMVGGDWGELRTARALRVDVVAPPGGDG